MHRWRATGGFVIGARRGRRPLLAPLWASWMALAGGCSSDAQVISHVGKDAVWQIAAAGGRVYAADDTWVTAYDFSDPSTPRELGRLESPGYFGAMAADGATLYMEVGIQFKGLEKEANSLDQQWIQRGWLNVDERSYSQGEFVGVSNLVAFDLTDVGRPKFLGGLNVTPADTLPSKVERMFLSGSTLYASPQFRGALIVDVRDPRLPRLLGSQDRGIRVALGGQRLFVADGADVTITSDEGREFLPGGLLVVDAADPGDLRELGRLATQQLGEPGYGANADTVAVLGDHAYVGLSILKGLRVSEFLVVVDVSNPAKPREVNRIRLKGGVQELGVVGQTLYAQAGGDILRFDLSDPAHPTQVGKYRQGEILRSVFTSSEVLIGTWTGLYALRFSPGR